MDKPNSILKYLVLILASLFFMAFQRSSSGLQLNPEKHPNILFIAIDDLRPELGCYGNSVVKSPNLDKLAGEGFLFQHQYAAVPTCGASRYSLLTGRYPQSRTDLSNEAFVLHQKDGSTPKPESLVEHLRNKGYYTVGLGKISHSADGLIYDYLGEPGSQKEMPRSWDEFLFDPGKWKTGWNAFFAYADGSDRNHKNKQVKPYEAADVPDTGYPDGLTAELALKKLQELKNRKQPFFLGVGFFKPHLPFNAPKKYWDMYNEKEIPLSESPGLPEDVNLASLYPSDEFNQYALGEEKAGLDHTVSDEYARKLRHGYYAGISYIDAQVGKLLAELERSGLAENTVVVIWGDHGWHLGDDRIWGKHTIFDRALRSAFILKLPGSSITPKRFPQIISSVDIYPTLVELCGFEMPYYTEGKSLCELWDEEETTTPWRNTAYSYYRNGISLRTPQYRLTQYFRKEAPQLELYDHEKDPFEMHNLAASRLEVVEKLKPLLDTGDTGLYKE